MPAVLWLLSPNSGLHALDGVDVGEWQCVRALARWVFLFVGASLMSACCFGVPVNQLHAAAVPCCQGRPHTPVGCALLPTGTHASAASAVHKQS